MKQYKLAPDLDIERLKEFGFEIDLDVGRYSRTTKDNKVLLIDSHRLQKFDIGIYHIYELDPEDFQDLIKANAVVEVESDE